MSGVPCWGAGFQNVDLTWMINFIKEFRSEQEGDFQKALDVYMEKYFNTYMMDATYDAGTKTIILSQVPTVSTASHALTDERTVLDISRASEGIDYGC